MTPITLHAATTGRLRFQPRSPEPPLGMPALVGPSANVRSCATYLPFDSLEHNRPRATLQDRPVNRRKARGSGLRLKAGGWGKYAVVDQRWCRSSPCSCLQAARGPPFRMATALRSLTAPHGAARFDNRVDVNLLAMPRLQRNSPGYDALPEFAAARRGGRTPNRSMASRGRGAPPARSDCLVAGTSVRSSYAAFLSFQPVARAG
jgi:hypothetical protein